MSKDSRVRRLRREMAATHAIRWMSEPEFIRHEVSKRQYSRRAFFRLGRAAAAVGTAAVVTAPLAGKAPRAATHGARLAEMARRTGTASWHRVVRRARSFRFSIPLAA